MLFATQRESHTLFFVICFHPVLHLKLCYVQCFSRYWTLYNIMLIVCILSVSWKHQSKTRFSKCNVFCSSPLQGTLGLHWSGVLLTAFVENWESFKTGSHGKMLAESFLPIIAKHFISKAFHIEEHSLLFFFDNGIQFCLDKLILELIWIKAIYIV